jgi:hypothetical protein
MMIPRIGSPNDKKEEELACDLAGSEPSFQLQFVSISVFGPPGMDVNVRSIWNNSPVGYGMVGFA